MAAVLATKNAIEILPLLFHDFSLPALILNIPPVDPLKKKKEKKRNKAKTCRARCFIFIFIWLKLITFSLSLSKFLHQNIKTELMNCVRKYLFKSRTNNTKLKIKEQKSKEYFVILFVLEKDSRNSRLNRVTFWDTRTALTIFFYYYYLFVLLHLT